MNSTLTIEFNSSRELSEFIERINPVIKIAYSNDMEIERLKNIIGEFERKEFERIQNTIDHKEQFIPDAHPDPAPQAEETIHFEPIHDANDPEPELNNPELEARTCWVCGKPVPRSKKLPLCSSKCYGTNWARENSSKKAKALHPASD